MYSAEASGTTHRLLGVLLPHGGQSGEFYTNAFRSAALSGTALPSVPEMQKVILLNILSGGSEMI